jgi:hypothetical protein
MTPKRQRAGVFPGLDHFPDRRDGEIRFQPQEQAEVVTHIEGNSVTESDATRADVKWVGEKIAWPVLRQQYAGGEAERYLSTAKSAPVLHVDAAADIDFDQA